MTAHDKLWAVVVNSERARILRYPEAHIHGPEPEILLRSPNANLHAAISVLSDPNATMERAMQSAVDYAARAEGEDMRAFADLIRTTLAAHLRHGDFRTLAIFASLRMLERLKASFDPDLRAAIVHEEVGNIAHISEPTLRERVRLALAQ